MTTPTTKSPADPSSGVRAAAAATVFVEEFTDGVLDPTRPMLGPVRSGGFVVANTAPGC